MLCLSLLVLCALVLTGCSPDVLEQTQAPSLDEGRYWDHDIGSLSCTYDDPDTESGTANGWPSGRWELNNGTCYNQGFDGWSGNQMVLSGQPATFSVDVGWDGDDETEFMAYIELARVAYYKKEGVSVSGSSSVEAFTSDLDGAGINSDEDSLAGDGSGWGSSGIDGWNDSKDKDNPISDILLSGERFTYVGQGDFSNDSSWDVDGTKTLEYTVATPGDSVGVMEFKISVFNSGDGVYTDGSSCAYTYVAVFFCDGVAFTDSDGDGYADIDELGASDFYCPGEDVFGGSYDFDESDAAHYYYDAGNSTLSSAGAYNSDSEGYITYSSGESKDYDTKLDSNVGTDDVMSPNTDIDSDWLGLDCVSSGTVNAYNGSTTQAIDADKIRDIIGWASDGDKDHYGTPDDIHADIEDDICFCNNPWGISSSADEYGLSYGSSGASKYISTTTMFTFVTATLSSPVSAPDVYDDTLHCVSGGGYVCASADDNDIVIPNTYDDLDDYMWQYCDTGTHGHSYASHCSTYNLDSRDYIIFRVDDNDDPTNDNPMCVTTSPSSGSALSPSDMDCDTSDGDRHPETVWYADRDGDGYFADHVHESGGDYEGYTYTKKGTITSLAGTTADAMCFCDNSSCSSTSGECVAFVAGGTSGDFDATACTPSSASSAECLPIEIAQCGDPEGLTSSDNDTDVEYTSMDWEVADSLSTSDLTDCDEHRDYINPGGAEQCDSDNLDEDCDGFADDDDTTASRKNRLFADDDGDGFGDSTTVSESCDASSLSGYVGYSAYASPSASASDAYYSDDSGCYCNITLSSCQDVEGDSCVLDSSTASYSSTAMCYCTDSDCDDCKNMAGLSCTASTSICEEITSNEITVDEDSATVSITASGTTYTGDFFDVDAVIDPDWFGSSYDYYDCYDDASYGGDVYPGAPSICDGLFNDCSDSSYSASTGELDAEQDDDSDDYIECEADSTAWLAAQGIITSDVDCDDTSAYIYPGATTEYCDGVYNACDDANLSGDWSTSEAPDDEIDGDSDGFVDCTVTAGVGWNGTGSPYPFYDDLGATDIYAGEISSGSCYCDSTCTTCVDQDGASCTPSDADGDGTISCDKLDSVLDCDDTSDAVFPNAPEQCDGAYNDCNDDAYSATSAPSDETDDDSDGYIECDNDGVTWAGSGDKPGGNDCLDEDSDAAAVVYPGADDLCDGVYNNCNDTGAYDSDGEYDEDLSPDDETDDDGDGHIECDRTDGSTWHGGGATPSGDDCLDDIDTYDYAAVVYPNAVEYCDGVYNDCEDDDYDLTEAPDDEVDDDGDGFVACEIDVADWADDDVEPYPFYTAFGGTEDDIVRVYVGELSAGACYCNNSSCDDGSTDASNACVDEDGVSCTPADADSDGSIDCTKLADLMDCDDEERKTYPGAQEQCDGVYNDCNSSAAYDSDGEYDNTLSPDDESDDDSDGYIECDNDGITWAGTGSKPGGGDCLDEGDVSAAVVYPGAEELCDGVYNDCDDTSAYDSDGEYDGDIAPDNETDDDGDGYIECDRDDGSTWYGGGATPDGDDCLDDDDTYSYAALVYPAAEEHCDGIYNDCDDDDYSLSRAPDGETDEDGDGFVSCDIDVSDWIDGDVEPYPFYDDFGGTEDDVARVYLGEHGDVSCYCNSSACDDVCIDQDGASCTPEDADSSGSIDCTELGSLMDCDDDEELTYPGAEEQCDGAYNDCDDSNGYTSGVYDPGLSPEDESDDDNDGYAECLGSASSEVDCDDTDDTRYPGADELCDGQFNDCEHFLLEDFEGVIASGCYCSDSGATACVDEGGATCSADADHIVGLSAAVTIDAVTYSYVEAAWYCPTSTCQLNLLSNPLQNPAIDDICACYSPDGESCDIDALDLDEDGKADDCVASPLSADLSDSFLTSSPAGLDLDDNAPPEEVDEDGDLYVECSGWEGKSTLSGSDCDDTSEHAVYVYPLAAERCDGVYNDCDDDDYDADSAPADERDRDRDGFVGCQIGSVVDWAGDSEPYPFYDAFGGTAEGVRDVYLAEVAAGACYCNSSACDDTCVDQDGAACTPADASGDGSIDCVVLTDSDLFGLNDCDDGESAAYPGAEEVCDGIYNDCADEDAYTDDDEYDGDSAPSDEVDGDSDGYVECDRGDHDWSGSADEPDGGEDCDDTNDTRAPSATELCDGQFNDCDHFLLEDFEGAVASGCYCTDDAATSCAEADGTVCTASADDLVGLTVSIVISGSTHTHAEAAWLCPSSDCLIDSDLDDIADCYNTSGEYGDLSALDADDDGYADDCIASPLSVDLTDSFVAASPTGLAFSSGAPPDEVDDDGDRYVECEFDSEIWEGSSSIRGGDDCDDESDWGKLVFVGAVEYCDGVYNDCDDTAYSASSAPDDELDGDGDGFVDCEPTDGIGWSRDTVDPTPYYTALGVAVNYDPDATDVDLYAAQDADGDPCYCVSACSSAATCADTDGAACTPDVATCERLSVFSDCDDEDGTVFPGAEEICDGLYNDCAASAVGWTDGATWPDNTTTSGTDYPYVPDDELDDDEDGYVECDTFSSSTWVGYGSDVAVTGGDDCDDRDATIYPYADEICDEQFNDCESPAQQTLYGAVSESGCYCAAADGSMTTCAEADGTSCGPTDDDGDNIMDHFAVLTDGVTIGGSTYYSVEISALCPEASCAVDADDDGYADCGDTYGARVEPDDSDGDGYADDCVAAEIEAYTYGAQGILSSYDDDGDGQIDMPFEEIDKDSDGSFECDDTPDCDDYDAMVYPDAEEICDGQYNDCSDGDYEAGLAPADETDDDSDGWVECSRRTSALGALDWAGEADEPNVWVGDAGDGCYCATADECDAALSTGLGRCVDEDGAICAPASCDDVVSAAETNGAFALIAGMGLIDCDDDDNNTFPGAGAMEGESAGENPYMADVPPVACMTDADDDYYGDDLSGSSSNLDCDDADEVCPGSDCDDGSEDVYPNQPEECESDSQVDDDCDGSFNTAWNEPELSEDGLGTIYTAYADEDEDGYGDADSDEIKVCVVGEGYSRSSSDCDDGDSSVHPEADELCDDRDNDCNDEIDEARNLAEEGSGCETYYYDGDRDGYGSASGALCMCTDGEDEISYNDPNNSDAASGYYVPREGDCVDDDADIVPLSCSDGIDNDGDGLADDDDPSCISGYDELTGETIEVSRERLDGKDNDCDGQIPLVELDCDGDGSLALLPLDGESIDTSAHPDFADYESYRDAWEGLGARFAGDLGLAACTEDATLYATCWGETLQLSCDAISLSSDEDGGYVVSGSGLWMFAYQSFDSGDRYTDGARTYIDGELDATSTAGDCDDQCDGRYPGADESCDGIDNNCSGTDGGEDHDGLPDAMDEDVSLAGTIAAAELDLDEDGYIGCDDFGAMPEVQWSSASCADEVTDDGLTDDCQPLCSLASPIGEERCDGFLNVCDAEDVEGDDEDDDGALTCGAWGEDDLAEDIYVLVWLSDGAVAAAEYDTDTDTDTSSDTGAADTGAFADTGEMDSGLSDTGGQDTGGQDTGDGAESASEAVSAADIAMVPLIRPRVLAETGGVATCDTDLADGLAGLLGEAAYDDLMAADSEAEAAKLLVEACGDDVPGSCAIVRATLSADADEETYDIYAGDRTYMTASCEELPEQWIARSVWQRERILEARQAVVEWECQRLYGLPCDEIGSRSSLLDGWAGSMASASEALESDTLWWKELGRFNPESIDEGALMECWGDPTDPTVSLSDETGGDCDDGEAGAHRDNAEGPDDLVGLYLGAPASCDTCLDGIDNNCDGNIDCDDPACARCFMGQGVGCGSGSDSPCASGGGCASSDGRSSALPAVVLLLLAAALRRRRERAA